MKKTISTQFEKINQDLRTFLAMLKLLLKPSFTLFFINLFLNVQKFNERMEKTQVLVFGAAYGLGAEICEGEFNRLIKSTGDDNYVGVGQSAGNDNQAIPFNPLQTDWNKPEWLENVKHVLGSKKFKVMYIDRCAANHIYNLKKYWDANNLGVPRKDCYQFIGSGYETSLKENKQDFYGRFYTYASPELKSQFKAFFKLFLAEDGIIIFDPTYGDYNQVNYLEKEDGQLISKVCDPSVLAFELANFNIQISQNEKIEEGI